MVSSLSGCDRACIACKAESFFFFFFLVLSENICQSLIWRHIFDVLLSERVRLHKNIFCMISFPRNNHQALPMCEVMFGCFYKGGKKGMEGYKAGCKRYRIAEGLGRWGWERLGLGEAGYLLLICLACVRVWLFATLWMVAHQAPLSLGFPRQEYWSGLPFPSPGEIPNPRIKLTSGFFTTEPPGKPLKFSKKKKRNQRNL